MKSSTLGKMAGAIILSFALSACDGEANRQEDYRGENQLLQTTESCLQLDTSIRSDTPLGLWMSALEKLQNINPNIVDPQSFVWSENGLTATCSVDRGGNVKRVLYDYRHNLLFITMVGGIVMNSESGEGCQFDYPSEELFDNIGVVGCRQAIRSLVDIVGLIGK
jgi:hypothetical protein